MGTTKNNRSTLLTVGQRIRQLRVSKNMSQTDLGKKIHLSQETISKIERGIQKPSLEQQISFAEYFGVTSGYLLTGEEFDTLDFIGQYISFDYKSLPLDTDIQNPVLKIDRALLCYLLNTARAKHDPSIPKYVRDSWLEKETEVFNNTRKDVNKNHEFVDVALVPFSLIYSSDEDYDHRYLDLWQKASKVLLLENQSTLNNDES